MNSAADLKIPEEFVHQKVEENCSVGMSVWQKMRVQAVTEHHMYFCYIFVLHLHYRAFLYC